MSRFMMPAYNPTPIQSPQNALLQGLEMQRAQQGNALQSMQLQALIQRQQQEQAAQAQQQQFVRGLPSPQMQASQNALAGGGGPTVANAQRMQPVDPRLQMQYGAMQAGLMSPMDYLNSAMPAPAKPQQKVVGDALVEYGPGGVKELYKADKGQKLPPGMQMGANGPEWIPGYLEGRGQVAAQGAARLTVNTAEKGLLQSLSGKVGDDVMNASEAARGAQKSLSTVGSMRQALSSAKAITGTAANQRAALAQLGYTLGIGPADNPETLAKTREMMMGFGQLELDAAAQMKGQGQITESERAILRRAAAGDITMTIPEIETVLNVTERRAKTQLARNKRNVETLKRMPNAAPLVDFLESNGQSTDGPEFKMPTAEDIAAEARRRAAARGGK